MLAVGKRLKEISAEISTKGHVSVTGLAARFLVTPETIRRDLSKLEVSGVLQRVHGGAIATDRTDVKALFVGPTPPVYDPTGTPLSAPTGRHPTPDTSPRPAAPAAPPVPHAAAVINHSAQGGSFDETLIGAICEATDNITYACVFIDHLTERQAHLLADTITPSASIVTACPSTATYLCVAGFDNTVMIGGFLNGDPATTVGQLATSAVREHHFDAAIITRCGFSELHGLSTLNIAVAAVNQAVISHSDQVLVACRRTQVGQEHLVTFGDVGDCDIVVTDHLSQQLAAWSRTHNFRVVTIAGAG